MASVKETCCVVPLALVLILAIESFAQLQEPYPHSNFILLTHSSTISQLIQTLNQINMPDQAAGSVRCAKEGCNNWAEANGRFCTDRKRHIYLVLFI